MFKKLTAYPNGEVVVEATTGTKLKLKPTRKVLNEYRSGYTNIPVTSRESSDIDLFDDIETRV